MQHLLRLPGEQGDLQLAGVLGQTGQLVGGQDLYLTQDERSVCVDHFPHHLETQQTSLGRKTVGQTHSKGGRRCLKYSGNYAGVHG